MNNKHITLLLMYLTCVMMLLTGCSMGSTTETVIIPGQEDMNIEEPNSHPFQVHTIYRLPDEITNSDALLGWTSSNAVLAVTQNEGITDQSELRSVATPYEQSKVVPGIDHINAQMLLSPDGKYVSQIRRSASQITLKIISLTDGQEAEVAKISNNDSFFLQDVSWSNNSKYLSYLLVGYQEEQSRLRSYDVVTKTTKSYTLGDLTSKGSVLTVQMSDDGESVLCTTYPPGSYGRANLLLGSISGDTIRVQYERERAAEQYAWLTADQFVFLGADRTLYVYDKRSSELSILLEKVNYFQLSHDKKSIAYSLYDHDVFYVGKVQGKNILSNEPVYRGLIANEIYWSQDNKSVLIRGQKMFSTSQAIAPDTKDGQTFIIEFR
ncbi:hypothetical protein [Paenibacillus massiliensis]|uniref:hypothetical protein n=1 Tax=Paenibacillus massiliensis TaxID=225917 RepID=UPI000472BC44|nr:hypothetical protein [Paenibacillus massiliensis]